MHALPRDVQSLIFSHLPFLPTHDVCTVDLVCKSWRAANANGGWKSVAMHAFGMAEWIKDPSVSWREALQQIVKPVLFRYRPMVDLKRKEGRHAHFVAMLTHTFEVYKKEMRSFPSELAGFLCAGAFLEFTRFGVARPAYRKDSVFVLEPNPRTNGKREFMYLGTAMMGGGDTQWWIYAVVSGSVRCPLAPKHYSKHHTAKDYGRAQDFGPGSIVIFSLWNHGGCEWDGEHLPPEYAAMDDDDGEEASPYDSGSGDEKEEERDGEDDGMISEFGCKPKYDMTQFDEWVRVCVEKPIGASKDALPCAWPSVAAFLDDVECSWDYLVRPANSEFWRYVSAEQGRALEAEDKKAKQ